MATAQMNMKLVDKKIVGKYKQTYGSSVDIDVESEEMSSQSADQSPSSKRLVLKIKNFRESKKKDDYYAEIRDSPLLRSEAAQNNDRAEKVCLKTGIKTENSSRVNVPGSDSEDHFYESCSDLLDSVAANISGVKSEPNDRDGSNMRDPIAPSSPGNDWDSFIGLQAEQSEPAIDQSASSARFHSAPDPRRASDNCKAANDWDSFIPAVKMEKEEVDANVNNSSSTRQTPQPKSTPDKEEKRYSGSAKKSSAEKNSSSKSSPAKSRDGLSANEKARRQLLGQNMDSSSGSESEDIFESLSSGSRKVKKTKTSSLDLDMKGDIKLKSECAVVVNRVADLVSLILTPVNNYLSECSLSLLKTVVV